MAIEEPLLHRRPEPTAHEWIDLWKPLALEHHRLCTPFAGSLAENESSQFTFVGVERFAHLGNRHRQAPQVASFNLAERASAIPWWTTPLLERPGGAASYKWIGQHA